MLWRLLARIARWWRRMFGQAEALALRAENAAEAVERAAATESDRDLRDALNRMQHATDYQSAADRFKAESASMNARVMARKLASKTPPPRVAPRPIPRPTLVSIPEDDES